MKLATQISPLLNMFYIWSTGQIWPFGSVIWYLLLGHPVSIYLVGQFRSNVAVSFQQSHYVTLGNSF